MSDFRPRMRTVRMRRRDLVFIWPPGIDIRQSLQIFDGVTDQMPVMRGTVHFRLQSGLVHCAHARKDLVLIWLQGKDIGRSMQIFVWVTDQMPVICGTIHVRFPTAHAHCAHVRKRSCHYLSARHWYQLISADLCFSYRSIACEARGYSLQIIDRAYAQCAWAEEIMSLSVHQL
jgi:hypothetical protein